MAGDAKASKPGEQVYQCDAEPFTIVVTQSVVHDLPGVFIMECADPNDKSADYTGSCGLALTYPGDGCLCPGPRTKG